MGFAPHTERRELAGDLFVEASLVMAVFRRHHVGIQIWSGEQIGQFGDTDVNIVVANIEDLASQDQK